MLLRFLHYNRFHMLEYLISTGAANAVLDKTEPSQKWETTSSESASSTTISASFPSDPVTAPPDPFTPSSTQASSFESAHSVNAPPSVSSTTTPTEAASLESGECSAKGEETKVEKDPMTKKETTMEKEMASSRRVASLDEFWNLPMTEKTKALECKGTATAIVQFIRLGPGTYHPLITPLSGSNRRVVGELFPYELVKRILGIVLRHAPRHCSNQESHRVVLALLERLEKWEDLYLLKEGIEFSDRNLIRLVSSPFAYQVVLGLLGHKYADVTWVRDMHKQILNLFWKISATPQGIELVVRALNVQPRSQWRVAEHIGDDSRVVEMISSKKEDILISLLRSEEEEIRGPLEKRLVSLIHSQPHTLFAFGHTGVASALLSMGEPRTRAQVKAAAHHLKGTSVRNCFLAHFRKEEPSGTAVVNDVSEKSEDVSYAVAKERFNKFLGFLGDHDMYKPW